jgi:hypothetical protein
VIAIAPIFWNPPDARPVVLAANDTAVCSCTRLDLT